MAATRYSSSPNDLRRQVGSPRSKGRENKDTLCRNVLIYGHCRYEDQGCAFNHDQHKTSPSSHPSPPSDFHSKRPFNVDSPSFTPSTHHPQPTKKSTFSSHAASAAPFTPRGVNRESFGQKSPRMAFPSNPAADPAPTGPSQSLETTILNPATIREFTPQNYDVATTNSGTSAQSDNGLYNDPFTTLSSIGQGLPPAAPFNPYAGDPNSIAASGAPFFPQQFPSGPIQPPNYHLYQPYDSYRQDLQPWQRSTYDFFIPEKIREDLQKKAFATQMVLPNSALPQLERWHTLFPLDTTNRKNASSFNYPSWMYKAKSSRNGRHYALRRLEGYRLTNENAVLSVMKDWKRVKNANIVSVHEIFTTREFGDSSLIFAFDFHPMSKTLQEQHLQHPSGPRFSKAGAISEEVLWSYICQMTSALKTIHSNKLAARCLDLSKIILTDKNRIRLAACSILDVVHYETNSRSIQELQQEDLVKFGKAMLALATTTPVSHLNVPMAVETMASKYSTSLKEAVAWLLSPGPPETKTIDSFISGISGHMTRFFDYALQDRDESSSQLSKELENGRIVRILLKLGTINERGDFAGTPNWSETGDRFQLKLYRDYVFHQQDADGKPNLSIGHMINSLNKLDAGIEEPVILTTRDNETLFIPTYRELRQMFDRTFNELVKQSKHGAPGSN